MTPANIAHWNTRKLPTMEELLEQFKPKEIGKKWLPEYQFEATIYEARAAAGDMR